MCVCVERAKMSLDLGLCSFEQSESINSIFFMIQCRTRVYKMHTPLSALHTAGFPKRHLGTKMIPNYLSEHNCDFSVYLLR